MPIGAFKLNTISAALATTGGTATASGGSVIYTYSAGTTYKIHTFTTTGNNSFIVSSINGSPTADILLVGGGGAGGGILSTAAGMGGAGGGGVVTYQTGVPITAQTYTIAVGAGGTGVSGADGNAGSSSTGLGYTAGGGGAGTQNSAATNGGGSGTTSTTSYTSTAGTYVYKGGNSSGNSTVNSRGSGGGAGYGGAGVNGGFTTGGNGGPGIQNNIDGNNYYYGSGGGGSGTTAGQAYTRTGSLSSTASYGAGRSSSGDGNSSTNTSAQYGSGGGGAMASATGTARTGGAGKQGVAIIKYASSTNFSLSYVTSANTTSSSITIPATAQAGDIAVLVEVAFVSTTASWGTLTNPSGFTQFTQSSNSTSSVNGSAKCVVSYKVLASGDPGSSVSGGTVTNATYNQVMMIYRPNLAINSVLNSASVETILSTAPSGTLILSGQLPWHLGLAIYGSEAGSISPRTSSTTETRELNSGTKLYVKTFEGLNGATTFSNSSISMSDYGVTNMLFGYVASFQ